MKKFIAFSGGVESSAMCVLFGGSADALFADAGWEHQEIYDRLDLVQSKVRELHGNDFTVHRVQGSVKAYGKECNTLPDYIKAANFYPSPLYRYCTDKFKIQPMDNFLKSQGKVQLMIGLNYDEQNRSIRESFESDIEYRYPLIENKITRDACKIILEKAGLLPNFPPYMQRGGCIGCFYKSKREFFAMAHLSPDEFRQVEAIEDFLNLQERKEHYAIRDGIPSMKELRLFAESSLFRPEEMYDAYDQPETPCGVFCNR